MGNPATSGVTVGAASPINFVTVFVPEFVVQTDPEASVATPTGVPSEPYPVTGETGVAEPYVYCNRPPPLTLLTTQSDDPSVVTPAGEVNPAVTGLIVAAVPVASNSAKPPPTAVPVVNPVATTRPVESTDTATGPCRVPSFSVDTSPPDKFNFSTDPLPLVTNTPAGLAIIPLGTEIPPPAVSGEPFIETPAEFNSVTEFPLKFANQASPAWSTETAAGAESPPTV
jgi:hypothetical protein